MEKTPDSIRSTWRNYLFLFCFCAFSSLPLIRVSSYLLIFCVLFLYLTRLFCVFISYIRRHDWIGLVNFMVLDHIWDAGKASAHFVWRAKRDRRCYRQHNIEKEANLCTVVCPLDSAMCLGHYFNARYIRVRLLYHCQPVANVHETHFTLRYQIGKHKHTFCLLQ